MVQYRAKTDPKTVLGEALGQRKSRPNRFRDALGTPRGIQERSKSVPRAFQERLRATKSAPGERSWQPRGSQRSPSRPSKASPRGFGDRYGAPKLQNNIFRESSVPRLARKNISKRFFNDFWSLRSNAGMRKTCKNNSFPRFSVGRVFFEKVGAVHGKSMKSL